MEGIPNKTGVFANRSFKTRIRHNSEGFRDAEHDKENRGGRFRILTVGDSFTWGHGVENDQVYMKVLEQIEPRVETINMGGPGGDPPSELKVYLSRGLEYEHDVVLMGFYVGNDVVTRVPVPNQSPPAWGFDEAGEFRLIGVEPSAEAVAEIRRQSEEAWASTPSATPRTRSSSGCGATSSCSRSSTIDATTSRR